MASTGHTPTILDERYGEGDTYLMLDILPPDLAENAFERLRQEVKWNTMSHRGGEVPRLVAVEGAIGSDGSIPVYRHPADESPPLHPFSPTVARIRAHAERALGGQPLNHALIQHYRHGGDYISEHSDKTVDVVRGSRIVNVSLGAQRTMTLRTKKDAAAARASASEGPDGNAGAGNATVTDRTTQRVPLPHNSLFVLGLETNAKWLHSIRTDKRPASTKTPAELAWGGERISLTFRHIGTFLTPDAEGSGGTAEPQRIWGQGARSKTRAGAGAVVRSGPEAEALLIAFGEENHKSEFDWDAAYGAGFDVLHFT